MQAPFQAFVWEMWAGHRCAWITIASIFIGCALLFRIIGAQAQKSDLLIAVCCLSAVFMLGLLMSAFNFTEVNARKGFAGFPQRLFTLPVRTCWLVAWPMVCAVVCVVALYVAWAIFIFQPLVEEQLEKAAASGFGGFAAVVRWPAVLLATAVVLYQSIIWCLSGFRITRLLVLGFVLTYVAAIGFLPFLPPSVNGTTLRGTWTEGKLTAVLVVSMLGAYATSVIVVGRQRRGGEIGWAWRRVLWQCAVDAMPHWQWKLSSADRALVWMEWRRSGFVLPMAVLLLALLILGPVTWLGGSGTDATVRSIWWLAASPLLLAIPIGRGMAKPDFWSLELGLSPFLAVRPITEGQIVAAKMKAAALSALMAYGVVLLAILAKIASGDPEHLHDLWGMFCTLYSPAARCMICGLAPLAMVMLTWNLLVGSLWLGCSGRPWFFYGGVAAGVVLLVAVLVAVGIFSDMSDSDSRFVLAMLHWIPWLLAAAFVCKAWTAVWR